MKKLSIKKASEQFGLSKARIYQLLAAEIVTGYRSKKRGRNADSWVDADHLQAHIKFVDEIVILCNGKTRWQKHWEFKSTSVLQTCPKLLTKAKRMIGTRKS